jgi:Ca2+-binding EF-hand superfamily protein
MNALRIVLLLIALAACVPAAAPPRVDPRIIPGDAHDLVLLHPSRPYRLRLHLQVARRSFLADWHDQVAALFAYLDVDGNGVLSQVETQVAPSRAQWNQLLRGDTVIEPDARPNFTDLKRDSPHVTVASLAAYCDHETAGPLQFRAMWRQPVEDPVSAALWKALDTDRDGKLSKAELTAAPRALAALDRDDDEVITPAEIRSARAVTEAVALLRRGTSGSVRSGDRPFLSQRPGKPTKLFFPLMLRQYDRDRDGNLSPREIGLPPADFARLDRDGNSRLIAAELAGWLDQAPDVSLVVPLENRPRRRVDMLEGIGRGLTTHPTRDGLWLAFGDHAVEVRRLDGRLATQGKVASAESAFRALDRNSDGFLDTAEVQTPPFHHVAWLRLADRDGDGRISRKEFEAFEALRRRLIGVTTFVQVDSHHRDLFALLDADHDVVLGTRELRTAWDRVAPWDKGGGPLTKAMIPLQFRATVSHGQPFAEFEPTNRQTRRQGQMAGPLWFSKMDRNGDGDISLKEWLGTREQFRAIDSDGDGLISLEEAEATDRKMREPRR